MILFLRIYTDEDLNRHAMRAFFGNVTFEFERHNVPFYTFARFKCVVTVTFVTHKRRVYRRFKCAKV